MEEGKQPIDTTNKFIVGARGSKIVVLGSVRELDRDDALTLAAWLVAIAGDKAKFEAIYDAVCST